MRSSPPSVFRGVRFTSCPINQVFSLNPLVSSYSLPETIAVPYVYITPQSHSRVHHSLITLSLYSVKSEIMQVCLNKPRILTYRKMCTVLTRLQHYSDRL